MPLVQSDVADTWDMARKKRELNGQTLAYAPSMKEGDTDFETEYVEFWDDVGRSNVHLLLG